MKFPAEFSLNRKENAIKLSLTKKLMLIIAALLVTKLILLLTSVPTPEVDYLAQANELSKPDGFSPEANAAPLYEAAFALYVEPPKVLRSSPLITRWIRGSILTGIDPNDLALARAWLAANEPALDKIRLAARQPYCWFKRTSEDGSMIRVVFNEVTSLRNASEALLCSARCHAMEGRYPLAAEDLLDAYHIGCHQNRSIRSFVEQLSGSVIQEKAVRTALEILASDQTALDPLASLQPSFEAVPAEAPPGPYFEMEKLLAYDMIQRLYLDPVRGIDRPAFRVLLQYQGKNGWDRADWKEAFWGYSRHGVTRRVDRLYELYDQLSDKTPWQIHRFCQPQVKEGTELSEDGFFMKRFTHFHPNLYSRFYAVRSQANALVTVLAVLRYRQDRGRLPESLEALAEAGYIKEPPPDPFSDGPLVYRVEGEDFVLYNRGEDFTDNGGELVFPGAGQKAATCAVFSSLSPQRTVEGARSKDIIYWPVIVELPDLSQEVPGDLSIMK